VGDLIPTPTDQELYDSVIEPLGLHRSPDTLSGEEVIRALSRMFERMGVRIVGWHKEHFILQAGLSAKASTLSKITFDSGTTEAFHLLEGSVLHATKWGIRYELAEELIITAAQAPGSSVMFNIRAENSGFDGNQEAIHIDEWAISDGVDPASALVFHEDQSTAGKAELVAAIQAEDWSFVVQADATGGSPGMLELLGRERGVPLQENESESVYRDRVHLPSDDITAAAIQRRVNVLLRAAGYGDCTIELNWEYGYQFGRHPLASETLSFPVSRDASFLVRVPSLTHDPAAWVPDLYPLNLYPFGGIDLTTDALLDALQAEVDYASAAGYWGLVVEEP
jgi:hypothetical protein